ncbi:hypothetical protein IAU60_005642 [Kwoniella sp. DSM 27419]
MSLFQATIAMIRAQCPSLCTIPKEHISLSVRYDYDAETVRGIDFRLLDEAWPRGISDTMGLVIISVGPASAATRASRGAIRGSTDAASKSDTDADAPRAAHAQSVNATAANVPGLDRLAKDSPDKDTAHGLSPGTTDVEATGPVERRWLPSTWKADDSDACAGPHDKVAHDGAIAVPSPDTWEAMVRAGTMLAIPGWSIPADPSASQENAATPPAHTPGHPSVLPGLSWADLESRQAVLGIPGPDPKPSVQVRVGAESAQPAEEMREASWEELRKRQRSLGIE